MITVNEGKTMIPILDRGGRRRSRHRIQFLTKVMFRRRTRNG